jgi:hypothetical protein
MISYFGGENKEYKLTNFLNKICRKIIYSRQQFILLSYDHISFLYR